jgi:hypothetical protein
MGRVNTPRLTLSQPEKLKQGLKQGLSHCFRMRCQSILLNHGALQTDGYEAYNIYENKKGVLPIGCWAYARRYFFEAVKEDKENAEYALQQIGLLYDIERRADMENLSYEERSELRTRLAYV